MSHRDTVFQWGSLGFHFGSSIFQIQVKHLHLLLVSSRYWYSSSTRVFVCCV